MMLGKLFAYCEGSMLFEAKWVDFLLIASASCLAIFMCSLIRTFVAKGSARHQPSCNKHFYLFPV